MGRAQRYDPPGGWHHVVNRGVDRSDIFLTAADGHEFLHLLGYASGKDNVEVHAFCLMPNHYHLLVHCPAGGLTPFMHRVSSLYARAFNDRTDREGPVFTGRFRSFPLSSAEYRRNTLRYIHRNPIDLRPRVDLASYRWSSFRYYCDIEDPPPWLCVAPLLEDDGGVSHHHAAVERHEPAGSTQAVRWALDLIVAEHADASTRRSLRRTLAVALADDLGPSHPAAKVLTTELASLTPAMRTQARRRARDRRGEAAATGALAHLHRILGTSHQLVPGRSADWRARSPISR